VLYDRWDERERDEAVRIVLPSRSPLEIPLRSAVVLLILGVAAAALASVGA